jgi:hypothetical protein
MAEEEEKKNSPDLLIEAIFFIGGMILLVIILQRLFAGISAYFSGDASFNADGSIDGGVSGSFGFLDTLFDIVLFVLPFLQILSIIISAVLVMLIIYVSRRKNEVIDDMKQDVYPPGYTKSSASYTDPIVSMIESDDKKKDPDQHKEEIININPRWKKIDDAIQSENTNDWRQAIIDADIMLDELLDTIGYKGLSVGDKLKQVEPSDMVTIDQAWEAHKYRNKIAHTGSETLLSKREARRIIGLFREVFEEFHFI